MIFRSTLMYNNLRLGHLRLEQLGLIVSMGQKFEAWASPVWKRGPLPHVVPLPRWCGRSSSVEAWDVREVLDDDHAGFFETSTFMEAKDRVNTELVTSEVAPLVRDAIRTGGSRLAIYLKVSCQRQKMVRLLNEHTRPRRISLRRRDPNQTRVCLHL
uniref:Uncharacterized protein n=1 Tax=Noctiluca scintillans TaxID=2966 RepID=A0A7S1B0S6_NOCSC|mmetsp:Transcript_7268/g.19877  ORF Transcript_7268/g.19877 Transcript_7268/m.19877 type:complete len:157 (+) Transcript_7268:3-473(+)